MTGVSTSLVEQHEHPAVASSVEQHAHPGAAGSDMGGVGSASDVRVVLEGIRGASARR